MITFQLWDTVSLKVKAMLRPCCVVILVVIVVTSSASRVQGAHYDVVLVVAGEDVSISIDSVDAVAV